MRRTILLAAAVAATSAPVTAGQIIFQATPPANVPQSAPLYRVAHTPLTQDILVRRGQSLGMPAGVAPTFVKTPMGAAIQWNASAAAVIPVMLFRDTHGTEMFATHDMMMEPPGALPPITDDVATRVANDWLSQHPGGINLRELSGTPKVLHLIHQGEMLDGSVRTAETQDESIVRFHRMLNNMEVIGPGDEAEVHVSNASAVTGIRTHWRRVRMIDKALPILPFSTVQQQFTQQMLQSVANSPENAVVTEIRFGYYSRHFTQEQGWYTPAYDFVVKFVDPASNQATGAEHCYLPAVDPTQVPEPLDPPDPIPWHPDPARISNQASPPANVPQTVPIYSVSPTLVNVDTLSIRADKLGMSIVNTKNTARGMAALGADKLTVLVMDPSGSEFFGRPDQVMNTTPGALPAIQDDIAIRAATSYLTQKAGFPGAELGTPVVSHLMNQTFDIRSGSPNNPTQDETIVTFPRLVQGPPGTVPTYLPVLGPSSGIQVFVGNDGNVLGHKALWRNIQPSNMTAQVMPYEQALQVVQRKALSMMGDGSVRLLRAQFGYYERPEGTGQNFLQPAYLFDAAFISTDDPNGGTSGHTQIAVPASPTPEEPLDEEPAAAPDAASDTKTAIPTMYGDFNGDGKVDMQDVIGVLHAVGGLGDTEVTPTQVTACDVSPGGFPGGDGVLGLDDGLRIMRSITGLDNIADGP